MSTQSQVDIEKLKNRDPVFLTEFFTEMNPRLFRMLAAKGIYKVEAEEIIHECWETFFVNLEKFEGRSTLKTFVFGILINKIRENRRRTNRIDLEEDSEKLFSRSFTQDGWWAQKPQDPFQIVSNQEIGLSIHDCLEGLSADQKSAFLLIESEGESAENVCDMIGVSVSNLRVLIFRAKEKLRNCLEGKVQLR